MSPISAELTGKRVKIIMNNGLTFYQEDVAAIIMDGDGLPIAIKLVNGGLFNWEYVAAVLPYA